MINQITTKIISFNYRKTLIKFEGFSESDWIFKKLKNNKTFYEIDLLRYISFSLPGRPDCILDVGANIGNHSVFFGKYISSKVIAFEPNKILYPILERNLARNNVDAKIYKYGLCDKETLGSMSIPLGMENNIGAGKILLNDDFGFNDEVVQLTSLDYLLTEIEKEISGRKISAIKIDVEGMEPNVLRGGLKLIRKYLPELYIEVSSPSQMQEIKSLLDLEGYIPVCAHAATPVWHFTHYSKYSFLRRFSLFLYITFEQTLSSSLHVARKLSGLARRVLNAFVLRMIETKHSISARFNIMAGITKIKRNPELIVSLTTIPERISRVHLCLDSLLCQSVRPDRIILWLSESNETGRPIISKDGLPKSLILLMKRGLEIRWTEDIRSYRKFIPTLIAHPKALIVTADDDIYYPSHWLRGLYEAYLREPEYIHCHRAHLINYDETGKPLPYREWEMMAQGFSGPSIDLFPTGVGGILYAPGHLDSEVLNKKTFLEICPKADDVWLKAMSLKAGVRCKKVAKHTFTIREVRIPNNRTLFEENVINNGNDPQIKAVIERYGVFQRGP
jgi:FkbM family methyltransferase